MVASTPVPRLMSRPAASSIRSRRAETRSLMAYLSATSQEARVSAMAARSIAGTAPRLASMRLAASAIELAAASLRSAERTRRLAAHSSIDLGQPHGPGNDGGEGEADHHRLHDDVGFHEHLPRRQVAREVVGLHHGGRRGRCHRRCGRAGAVTSLATRALWFPKWWEYGKDGDVVRRMTVPRREPLQSSRRLRVRWGGGRCGGWRRR